MSLKYEWDFNWGLERCLYMFCFEVFDVEKAFAVCFCFVWMSPWVFEGHEFLVSGFDFPEASEKSRSPATEETLLSLDRFALKEWRT